MAKEIKSPEIYLFNEWPKIMPSVILSSYKGSGYRLLCKKKNESLGYVDIENYNMSMQEARACSTFDFERAVRIKMTIDVDGNYKEDKSLTTLVEDIQREYLYSLIRKKGLEKDESIISIGCIGSIVNWPYHAFELDYVPRTKEHVKSLLNITKTLVGNKAQNLHQPHVDKFLKRREKSRQEILEQAIQSFKPKQRK